MFFFIIFGLVALVAAIGVVVSRKPVYSALFLLLNFAMLAALYILLEAQFLAAVQVIVYAGAIVVLFLFVVMLIGGGEFGPGDREASRNGDKIVATTLAAKGVRRLWGWPRVAALVLALLFVAVLGYALVTGHLFSVSGDAAAFGQGSIEAIGSTLYTDYLLPFELTSVLLLVGMVGAVVLARND